MLGCTRGEVGLSRRHLPSLKIPAVLGCVSGLSNSKWPSQTTAAADQQVTSRQHPSTALYPGHGAETTTASNEPNPNVCTACGVRSGVVGSYCSGQSVISFLMDGLYCLVPLYMSAKQLQASWLSCRITAANSLIDSSTGLLPYLAAFMHFCTYSQVRGVSPCIGAGSGVSCCVFGCRVFAASTVGGVGFTRCSSHLHSSRQLQTVQIMCFRALSLLLTSECSLMVSRHWGCKQPSAQASVTHIGPMWSCI